MRLIKWITKNFDKSYEYDGYVTYKENDVVIYKSNLYQSVTNKNINNDPTNSPNWIKIK